MFSGVRPGLPSSGLSSQAPAPSVSSQIVEKLRDQLDEAKRELERARGDLAIAKRDLEDERTRGLQALRAKEDEVHMLRDEHLILLEEKNQCIASLQELRGGQQDRDDVARADFERDRAALLLRVASAEAARDDALRRTDEQRAEAAGALQAAREAHQALTDYVAEYERQMAARDDALDALRQKHDDDLDQVAAEIARRDAQSSLAPSDPDDSVTIDASMSSPVVAGRRREPPGGPPGGVPKGMPRGLPRDAVQKALDAARSLLRDKEGTIDNLTLERDRALEDLEEQRSAFEEELAGIHGQMDELRFLLAERDDVVEEARRTVAHLQDKLARCEAERQRLQESLGRLRLRCPGGEEDSPEVSLEAPAALQPDQLPDQASGDPVGGQAGGQAGGPAEESGGRTNLYPVHLSLDVRKQAGADTPERAELRRIKSENISLLSRLNTLSSVQEDLRRMQTNQYALQSELLRAQTGVPARSSADALDHGAQLSIPKVPALSESTWGHGLPVEICPLPFTLALQVPEVDDDYPQYPTLRSTRLMIAQRLSKDQAVASATLQALKASNQLAPIMEDVTEYEGLLDRYDEKIHKMARRYDALRKERNSLSDQLNKATLETEKSGLRLEACKDQLSQKDRLIASYEVLVGNKAGAPSGSAGAQQAPADNFRSITHDPSVAYSRSPLTAIWRPQQASESSVDVQMKVPILPGVADIQRQQSAYEAPSHGRQTQRALTQRAPTQRALAAAPTTVRQLLPPPETESLVNESVQTVMSIDEAFTKRYLHATGFGPKKNLVCGRPRQDSLALPPATLVQTNRDPLYEKYDRMKAENARLDEALADMSDEHARCLDEMEQQEKAITCLQQMVKEGEDKVTALTVQLENMPKADPSTATARPAVATTSVATEPRAPSRTGTMKLSEGHVPTQGRHADQLMVPVYYNFPYPHGPSYNPYPNPYSFGSGVPQPPVRPPERNATTQTKLLLVPYNKKIHGDYSLTHSGASGNAQTKDFGAQASASLLNPLIQSSPQFRSAPGTLLTPGAGDLISELAAKQKQLKIAADHIEDLNKSLERLTAEKASLYKDLVVARNTVKQARDAPSVPDTAPAALEAYLQPLRDRLDTKNRLVGDLRSLLEQQRTDSENRVAGLLAAIQELKANKQPLHETDTPVPSDGPQPTTADAALIAHEPANHDSALEIFSLRKDLKAANEKYTALNDTHTLLVNSEKQLKGDVAFLRSRIIILGNICCIAIEQKSRSITLSLASVYTTFGEEERRLLSVLSINESNMSEVLPRVTSIVVDECAAFFDYRPRSYAFQDVGTVTDPSPEPRSELKLSRSNAAPATTHQEPAAPETLSIPERSASPIDEAHPSNKTTSAAEGGTDSPQGSISEHKSKAGPDSKQASFTEKSRLSEKPVLPAEDLPKIELISGSDYSRVLPPLKGISKPSANASVTPSMHEIGGDISRDSVPSSRAGPVAALSHASTEARDSAHSQGSARRLQSPIGSETRQHSRTSSHRGSLISGSVKSPRLSENNLSISSIKSPVGPRTAEKVPVAKVPDASVSEKADPGQALSEHRPSPGDSYSVDSNCIPARKNSSLLTADPAGEHPSRQEAREAQRDENDHASMKQLPEHVEEPKRSRTSSPNVSQHKEDGSPYDSKRNEQDELVHVAPVADLKQPVPSNEPGHEMEFYEPAIRSPILNTAEDNNLADAEHLEFPNEQNPMNTIEHTQIDGGQPCSIGNEPRNESGTLLENKSASPKEDKQANLSTHLPPISENEPAATPITADKDTPALITTAEQRTVGQSARKKKLRRRKPVPAKESQEGALDAHSSNNSLDNIPFE